MLSDPTEMMSAHFTGLLDEDGQARLFAWVGACDANADQFAMFALEHHALKQVLSNEKYGDLADLSLSDFLVEDGEAGPMGDSQSPAGVLDALAELEMNAPTQGPVSITERILRERIEQERANDPRRRGPAGATGPRVIVIPRSAVIGAIAAMVLLAVVLIMNRGPEEVASPPTAGATALPAVAVFEADLGAAWAGAGPNAGQGMVKGDYQLVRGRAQLRFEDGAMVVVEAPARFALDSTNGMTLSDGRLVAYCDVRARGFVVQTPHAEFVDLGTEFGVHVVPGMGSQIHVFEGEVRARPTGASVGSAATLMVTTSRAYAATAGARSLVALPAADEDIFATTRHVEVPVWSTGEGLSAEVATDPNWRVTQINGQTLAQPIPAVGHALKENYTSAAAQQFRKSVIGELTWLIPDPERDLADQDSYTYETTFQVQADIDLQTLVLEIGFLADNYVSEIRLNGRRVVVPEHSRTLPFLTLTRTQVAEGFVVGENRLEIVINNKQLQESTRLNRTALMAELKLTGQKHWKPASRRPGSDQ